MKKNFPIYSKRFIIRKFRTSFVNKKYLYWFNNTLVNRYIEFKCKSLNDLKKNVLKKIKTKNSFFLAIFFKKHHIGNIFIHNINLKKKSAFVGILIGIPKWRGKGVGFETINSVIEWLYSKNKIRKFYLGVHISNKFAINLYRKLGFKNFKKKTKTLIMRKILFN
jgi:RimJ/RimL family protein N-acetyltransferase